MSTASAEAKQSSVEPAEAGVDSVTAESRTIGAGPAFGILMAVLGAVGLFFSGLIMQDKVTLLSDPGYIPACTVNAIVSCTDVMASPQASAFGFANPYIGLVGFALVAFFGVSLAAGVRFPEWMWAGELLGLIFAVGFVHWLAYEAVFEIGALCVYCMAVWTVTLPLFLMTLVRFTRGRAYNRNKATGQGVAQPVIVLIAWYLGFVVIIGSHFFF